MGAEASDRKCMMTRERMGVAESGGGRGGGGLARMDTNTRTEMILKRRKRAIRWMAWMMVTGQGAMQCPD
eukprot:3878591-Pyramimonas_sp.AAC.1